MNQSKSMHNTPRLNSRNDLIRDQKRNKSCRSQDCSQSQMKCEDNAKTLPSPTQLHSFTLLSSALSSLLISPSLSSVFSSSFPCPSPKSGCALNAPLKILTLSPSAAPADLLNLSGSAAPQPSLSLSGSTMPRGGSLPPTRHTLLPVLGAFTTGAP